MIECNLQPVLERLDKLENLINSIIDSGIGQKKKKRKPSAYNQFIGQCMKQGKDMKTCATEYKRSKQ